MCWDATVSLQTFTFAMAAAIVLGVTKMASMPLLAYAISFSSMQLIEYFLWTFIDNPVLNHRFSLLGIAVLGIQPVLAIAMISNPTWRMYLWIAYAVFLAAVLAMYGEALKDAHVARSPKGHLDWIWLNTKKYGLSLELPMLWLAFIIVAIILSGNYALTIICGIALAYSIYVYSDDETWTSMWCMWSNLYWVWLLIAASLQDFTQK